MADRLNEDSPRKRQSGLLDAIFDVVEQEPTKPTSTADESMFRAKAIEQIDVPAQVDLLLPLTSRMTWIALVGAALVILAGIFYTAGTERISAISSDGRAVNLPGLAVATSPVAGSIGSVAIAHGERATSGAIIASGNANSGSTFKVTSPINGMIWQVLVPVGGSVAEGGSVATILPDGPQTTVLTPVPEASSSSVKVGQKVLLTKDDETVVDGTVSEVSSQSLPASSQGDLAGIPTSSSEPQVLVTIRADSPLTPGSPLGVKIVLSKKSLLQQLLEFR